MTEHGSVGEEVIRIDQDDGTAQARLSIREMSATSKNIRHAAQHADGRAVGAKTGSRVFGGGAALLLDPDKHKIASVLKENREPRVEGVVVDRRRARRQSRESVSKDLVARPVVLLAFLGAVVAALAAGTERRRQLVARGERVGRRGSCFQETELAVNSHVIPINNER